MKSLLSLSRRSLSSDRRFYAGSGVALWLLLLALAPASGQRLEDYAAGQETAVNTADPAEVYVKAYTSVKQGDALEQSGKLRPALAKFRYAASLLEQLAQTNPNWQPLLVQYRGRKTIEDMRRLEDKLALHPPTESTSPPDARSGTTTGTADEDDLPVADNPTGRPEQMTPNSPVPPSVETISRASIEQTANFNRLEQELKTAQTDLARIKKEKQAIVQQLEESEFQRRSNQSSAKGMDRRLSRIKADRDDLQKQLTLAQDRLTEAKNKNPDAAETRKELRAQVALLQKSLAKAERDATAVQKEREAAGQKLTEAEGRNSKLIEERDQAVAQGAAGKEAVEKIQFLQTENEALTKKLAAAEESITQLTTEAVKKKEELAGMQKELTAVKEQLVTSRDQQDRAATTVTELRQKLDEDGKQIADLKTKGVPSEELARMTNENNLLKDIVVRQLKVDANRALARKLVNDELARLEVQSTVLNQQIEQLGRPTVPLTDEERNLFKEPATAIMDTTEPDALASKITAIKPKPASDPSVAPAAASPGAAASPAAVGAAPDAVAANGSPAAGGAPEVDTTSQPKVPEELQGMARQAEESFHRGKFPEAEDAYKKLLARDPKNIYLLSNQGAVLSRQNKLKSAEVVLKKAMLINAKDAYTLATLGIVYYRMHRYDDALECLTKAVQYDPKNATAHNYLGITSSQKGWPEAALEEIQKALTLNPQYADAHFNIAVIYATNQPPAREQAQEHYKIATALGAAPDPALEKLLSKK